MTVMDLLEDLAVQPVDTGRYRGSVPRRNLPRMFGGQILGQALLAATATCTPDRPAHSLHGSFLRPGDPTVPVDYLVQDLRDSRAFATRRVDAYQGQDLIATVVVSFHRREDSLSFDRPAGADMAAPAPQALPPLGVRLAALAHPVTSWWTDPLPFDVRFLREPTALAGTTVYPDAHQQFWIRTHEPMPADPAVHMAVLAYASDLNLLDVALLPEGASWYGDRKVFGASIDHSMWFHDDIRVDQWLLCSQTTDLVHRARALCHAQYRQTNGSLVASAAQEGLLRWPQQPAGGPASSRSKD